MNERATVASGLPSSYWLFRNLVSLLQIGMVVALFAVATVWALTDGNGTALIADFYEFSQGVTQWANENTRYPWE